MPALPKDMVAIAIKSGATTRAQVTTAPRFKAGDKVVARNINPPTHTRLPRYIRGKHGVVQHNHGWLRLRRYPRARARRPAAPCLQRAFRGARIMGR